MFEQGGPEGAPWAPPAAQVQWQTAAGLSLPRGQRCWATLPAQVAIQGLGEAWDAHAVREELTHGPPPPSQIGSHLDEACSPQIATAHAERALSRPP